MFKKLTAFLTAPPPDPVAPAEPVADIHRAIATLNRDPYLALADDALRLISVFDDMKYDRADLDLVSGPMRAHALSKLAPLGFRQVSGSVIANAAHDLRIYIPKFRALGASPFDALRERARDPEDYALLTPTQAACQIIDNYPADEAVAKLKPLVCKHPVNLLRIEDFLEQTDRHQAFLSAIGHLKFVQREAVEAEPLRSRRALR